jgi:hypothetical protein
MSIFIPPARIRHEDELFINSLALQYRDSFWDHETLRSISADALRMIRHLASRYSDPTCMELNAEELEAEGRRKFIEQVTVVKVLTGLPQRLHIGDLVVSFNGAPVSDTSQLAREIGRCAPRSEAVIEYLRWPKTRKNEEEDKEDNKPKMMKAGAIKFTLGDEDGKATVSGVTFKEMDDDTRWTGLSVENFNPYAAVVDDVDSDDSLVCGRAPRPPTRVELFSWLKCCANNHIRGIVHRCRFTVRRTGRRVPSKDSNVDWNRSFKPEVSLEAASEDEFMNRAVERAASVWDSHAVQEFDEDMGASRYAYRSFSHPSNSNLTIKLISLHLRLLPNDLVSIDNCAYLNLLADHYRENGCSVRYTYTPQASA